MITLAELQQIYRPQYFEERTGTLNVCEKQKQDDIQSLREIRLTYTGKVIFVNGIASLHLSPNLAMQSLYIKHCPVSATVASIDLDELIGVAKC